MYAILRAIVIRSLAAPLSSEQKVVAQVLGVRAAPVARLRAESEPQDLVEESEVTVAKAAVDFVGQLPHRVAAPLLIMEVVEAGRQE